MNREIKSISIKFQPEFYGQFENFNNKVWNVIGEYVDNALQSYIGNKIILKKNENNYQFKIKISIDKNNDKITIEDNAAGINEINIIRALEVANRHSDVSGLNEFGMGLKTSSNWLSKSWKLCTTAIGEEIERTVMFDLHQVKQNKLEELPISNRKAKINEHYTKITLNQLTKNAPSNLQIEKIKKHLASIYRKYIASNEMILIINEEILNYDEPKILKAPYYKDNKGKEIYWKKEINFAFKNYRAVGFIGILNTMSSSEHNGLSLFRRGRVIEGSYDEKYRPKLLFSQPGSFLYKRLFGELELEGFNVSFNKGSFQEQDELENLIQALRIELSSKDLDIIGQASNYRPPKNIENNKKVAKGIVETLKKDTKKESIDKKVNDSIKDISNKSLELQDQKIIEEAIVIDSHEDHFEMDNKKYQLKLELINDTNLTELYRMNIVEDKINSKKIEYKINLAHPFFTRYDQFNKKDDYLPIIAIIKALVLAEERAPLQGTIRPGNIRNNFNRFLKNL